MHKLALALVLAIIIGVSADEAPSAPPALTMEEIEAKIAAETDPLRRQIELLRLKIKIAAASAG
jgi:hypothetical protein